MKELLKQLRESENFQAIMREIVKNRPVIAEYRPQSTRDETENLIEQIKYETAKRSGFDLLYTLLSGSKP
jgi:hypothetical protein